MTHCIPLNVSTVKLLNVITLSQAESDNAGDNTNQMDDNQPVKCALRSRHDMRFVAKSQCGRFCLTRFRPIGQNNEFYLSRIFSLMSNKLSKSVPGFLNLFQFFF
jgi:hypothetical protein